MIQQAEKKTPEQMVEAVFALNLDPIKFKLMDKKEGYGWTREEADRHELEYRRFLALVAKYPDDVITPDTNVDKFWHGHILDTMKYAEDCQAVFGYFLHHFPYFGMRDAEDAANLAEAAAQTRRLYEQEFGTAAAGDAAYCARAADADATYCARVADADATYCARVAGQAGVEESAYCGRVAGAEGTAPGASYCARVATDAGKEAAYCAATTSSYCARVAGDAAAPEAAAAYCAATTASYCARVAGKAEQSAAYCAATAPSYCARVAGAEQAYCAVTSAGYRATVLGKGRPTLEPATA